MENEQPNIFGNGKQIRDFVYVKDLVKALAKAIENPKTSGKVFNLSSGQGISVKELAEILIQFSGKKLQTGFDDPAEGEASRFQPRRIRLMGELEIYAKQRQSENNPELEAFSKSERGNRGGNRIAETQHRKVEH